MLETSTLISCTGKITRVELAHAPTPPSTATHVPIRSAAIVEASLTPSVTAILSVSLRSSWCSRMEEICLVLNLALGLRNADSRPKQRQER